MKNQNETGRDSLSGGKAIWCLLGLMMAMGGQHARGSMQPVASYERMAEWTIESKKAYTDPFNDVDVDVVFSKDGQSWRMPTFWRGGSEWTVRFSPPTPGEYLYHLECTDKTNPDLNGHEGRVTVTAYTGDNALFRHGMLRVSENKRYFEQADGTPFYWLGDTWWTGLSTRLSWEGFQTLTADRKAKGFTVVQIVAGLIPGEEQAPSDPGYCNEGGCAWDPGFHRINPKYFDYADRRIEHLLDAEIVPAIVGAWSEKLEEMGIDKLKKHWRYVIARYAAYPAFWVIGGEVFDPPSAEVARQSDFSAEEVRSLGGWTEVGRYIRATDPVHHPVTVHESVVPASIDGLPLQDEAVTDFHLFQPSHFSWSSVILEITQLDTHYARTEVTKPLVVGEIGYERLGETHLEDFQRVAFWLGMLNGAAGHTYGANGTWEAYTADKPFHRLKWSLLTWEEGMDLPGSYQVGLGAKLLRQYPWWRFAPHPEWVTPRGTTLLEPRHDGVNQLHSDLSGILSVDMAGLGWKSTQSEWQKRDGNFRLPYAAGIPGEVRFIYIPYFGLIAPTPPTVLGLEPGVGYHAYYWEPSLGVKFDLGAVERPAPGPAIYVDKFEEGAASRWTDYGAKSTRGGGRLSATGPTVALLDGTNETNVVVGVDIKGKGDAGLILRFHDADDYLAAVYSAKEKTIYLLDRKKGVNGNPLGTTSVPDINSNLRLTVEAQGPWAVVSITDGAHIYTSEIVRVGDTTPGGVGLLHTDAEAQAFADFELRRSVPTVADEPLERRLRDARGGYRGSLRGPGLPPPWGTLTSSWDDFGREKIVLLDAYRPDRLPYGRDWVLVLEKQK